MQNVFSIQQLEETIGYSFKNKMLLEQAVTHSSYANERMINKLKDYERIEFLGDAVLENVTSEFIFFKYPDMSEGNMTKLRASLVCEMALAHSAKQLKLGGYILLGKGEEKNGGRERDSIIADVTEAIIGAIYLDAGLEEAKKFIYTYILNDIENKKLFYDCKTSLQEMMQKEGKKLSYKLVGESGPEHMKEFCVEVIINNRCMGRGKGKNKKEAEQRAAYETLLLLQNNVRN